MTINRISDDSKTLSEKKMEFVLLGLILLLILLFLFTNSFFKKVVVELMKLELAAPFSEPVNFVELNLTDYLSIVSIPMDLCTIRANLFSQAYGNNTSLCLSHFILLWDNCYHYNGPTAPISKMANNIQELFVQRMINSGLFSQDEIDAAQASTPNKYAKPASFVFFSSFSDLHILMMNSTNFSLFFSIPKSTFVHSFLQLFFRTLTRYVIYLFSFLFLPLHSSEVDVASADTQQVLEDPPDTGTTSIEEHFSLISSTTAARRSTT